MPEQTFADLRWALAVNTHSLENSLLEAYKDRPKYLEYINDLVSFLRAHHCNGIQEKLGCVSCIPTFRSVQSELEVAKELIERGKRVSLLPDRYAHMDSPPDMLVGDSLFEAYIEVKLVIDDPVVDEVVELLRQLLRSDNYPYIVELELSSEMSIPVTRNYEIEERKGMVKEALQQLEEEIKTVSSSSLPKEIRTVIGRFKILRSESGRGLLGPVGYSVIEVPGDKLVEKIRWDIKKKASKREGWSEEHRARIYIVALDFAQKDYDKKYLEEALIGQRVTVMPPLEVPPVPEMTKVRRARERGWEDYLHRIHIIPNRTYLDPDNMGVFLTESVVKNVSGVIGRFGKEVYFVPNPFSHDEVNDPRLVNYI